MDLGLNEFHLDLQELLNTGDADALPFGIHAVARSTDDTPPGVIFVLKNVNHGVISADKTDCIRSIWSTSPMMVK